MASAKGRRVCVVQLNCEVIGAFSNLKKACEEMKENDPEFRSYSSLSRRRANENPIKFSTEKGDYQISIENID